MGKRKVQGKSHTKTSKELARERLKLKSNIYKTEKLQDKAAALGLMNNGVGDVKAYKKYKVEQQAKNAGFKDYISYRKNITEQIAKKAGFVDEDGNGNFRAYRKHQFSKKHMAEQTREKADFVDDNPDINLSLLQ